MPLPIDDNCKTIAEAYLKLRGSTLSSAEIKVIRNGVKYSPDIYEVCSFNGDQVIAVGSISKQKISIFQPGLSKQGKSGDFLMAHAIPATLDHHILLGSSNFITRKAKPLVQKFCSLAERCDNSRPGAFETLQSDFFNLFYDLVNFAAPTK